MNSQVFDLIDGVGDFIEYWGFKKIHGKIWVLIFLAKDPVDAKYLMDNLHVSKALISISLKELISYNVIVMSPKNKSTIHYVSNPNLSEVIINVILSREAKMLLKIKNSCELLLRRGLQNDSDPKVSLSRLKKLNSMVRIADGALKTFTTLKQFNFKDIAGSFVINDQDV